MTTGTERLSAVFNANTEAVLKCAMAPMEGTQKMFALQAKTYQDLWTSSTQQLKEMWSARLDPSQAAADWPKVFQQNMQKAVDINLAYFKTATELQTELARVAAEQMPALNKQLFESVDEIVRAAVATVEDASPGAAAPEHRTKKAA